MLFGFLMWEEAVYELAVAVPLQLLVIFLLTRMLELRHARVFWTCEILIIVVFCLLRMQVPSTLLPFVGERRRACGLVEEMLAVAKGSGA